ncbi:MAG TPA: hypothetical protein VF468_30925, partial [Actinomycetota bacterium]|nr:hypothetical protein [Actinomycetota bacterium]
MLDAGLLDEVHVDLVPVFLGSGIPLLGMIKDAPVELDGPSRDDALAFGPGAERERSSRCAVGDVRRAGAR